MAEQRLQPLFDQFAKDAPQRFPKEVRPLVRSLVETQWAGGFVPTLLLIFAASLLLLLLACANVSILLLARGTSRAYEFVVRAALGASRGRLTRQLLVESLLLAVAGAALGVALAYWGLPAVLRRLPPNSVPVGNLMAVPVNVPVLLFSAGLAMASALVSGLLPALSFSRPRLTATARTTAGVQGRRAHHLLLAAQIAVTVLLLAGTGAAVRVLIGLYRTSLGYDPHDVIVATINLPENTLQGMGRPRHVLRAPAGSHGRSASGRVGRARHLQRDTTAVGRTVGGRSSRPGHDRKRSTDSPTDQRRLLFDDEDPAHARPRVVRFRERWNAPRRRRQPNDGSCVVA